MIPYGRQCISEADIQAVVDVLRSDYLTQGPAVPRFETSVAKACSAAHAIAMNSATSALHVACLALGVGPGDRVWTSPITFVASANCALYCGASVDFVDIDPDTFNICPARLEEKLIRAERDGHLPKVVIPVHMCGQSCDMAPIARLAQKYGFRIIEDASHAIGGSYRGEPVGSCRYSNIAVLSFHPVKIVTTGEGGVAVTQSADLARRMQLLRSHGITRDPELMANAPDGPWYYEQLELGFNYRMTDIAAALGASQMKRLAEFVDRRNELAERYDRLLADLPILLPGRQAETRSSFHLYVIRLEDAAVHRSVFETLRSRGIGVNLHYIPVYRQPFYAGLGIRKADFPAAEGYYARAISIPIYQGLFQSDFDTAVQVLRDVVA
jgi:UDP-4-amino-4,6-dideoxy-N-acetyl-beta-L-altrosamine transaminase